MKLIIGAVIVVVLLMVIAAAIIYYKRPQNDDNRGPPPPTRRGPPVASGQIFSQHDGINFKYGMLGAPKQNSADGNIRYVAAPDSRNSCEQACREDAICSHYTFVDSVEDHNSGWLKQCYLINSANPPVAIAQLGMMSGSKVR